MSDENDANKPGKLKAFEEFLKQGRQSGQQSEGQGVDPEVQARIDKIMPKPKADEAASDDSPKKPDIH